MAISSKNIITIVALCIFTCTISSCMKKSPSMNTSKNVNMSDEESSDEDTLCTCPHATIILVPYDNFTVKEAQTLKKELKPKLDEMAYGVWKIKVGSPQALKKNWYYAPRNRYRADRIVGDLNKITKGDTVRIALLHKDISTSIHHQKDYGIMGLSFLPSSAAVVSTYRLKRHSDLWKVTMHEFLHCLGWPHCPNDDPHCIMQDAHGKNTFYQKNRLCKDCAEMIG